MKITKILSIFLFLFLVVGCCVNNSEYSEEVVSSDSKGVSFESNSNDDVLLSNVIIYNNNYSSILGLTYRKNNSYGSGFIFDSDDEYYYVLTNNHVVNYDYSFMFNELVIEDYYGNKYVGEVLKADLNYDLALVRFARENELSILNISDDNEEIRENVRTMGNPNEVKNVVTTGKINCYSYVNVKNEASQVNFEVIVHSAPISGGSSGGALLNDADEVVGITFAGVFDKNDNFVTAYAIPVSQIHAFLG